MGLFPEEADYPAFILNSFSTSRFKPYAAGTSENNFPGTLKFFGGNKPQDGGFCQYLCLRNMEPSDEEAARSVVKDMAVHLRRMATAEGGDNDIIKAVSEATLIFSDTYEGKTPKHELRDTAKRYIYILR